jgi:hypothetical protein
VFVFLAGYSAALGYYSLAVILVAAQVLKTGRLQQWFDSLFAGFTKRVSLEQTRS